MLIVDPMEPAMELSAARIILAEDERIISDDIKYILEAQGYRLSAVVSSSEELIRKVEELNPDLILMDIVLKGSLDGIEAALKIKEKHDIPIVYITAHSDEKTVQRAKLSQPYGYIIKPIDKKDLYSTIETVLYRHGLEKSLKESERKYRMVVENTNDIVYAHDLDGVFTFINNAVEHIFNYRVDEIVGKPFSKFVHPDDLPLIYKHYRAILKGSRDPYDFRVLDKNGGIHFVRTSSRVIVENGTVVGVSGIMTDITERRRADELIRMSEEKYRQLFETVSESIIIFDVDTFQIIDVNHAAIQLYGYSKEEFIGMSATALVADDEQAPKAPGDMTTGIVTGVPFRHHKKKNGTIIPVEITSGFFMLNNRSIGIAAIRDITKRKKLEDDITRAQKFESIAILAGGIAHDFNNILTAITGNIALAKFSIKPEDEAYENIIEIEKAAEQAKDLSLQLLNFGRLSKPILQKTSVIDLLKDSTLFSPEDTLFDLELHLAPDLWPAKVDVAQIRRVIHNLVTNAKESMPEGGTITIRAENATVEAHQSLPLAEGSYVKISIEDQGGGIPGEDIAKIFDPYFSSKKVYSEKGTGLGLSLVYAVVKRHKGHIAVQSIQNAGSMFTLYLPAARS